MLHLGPPPSFRPLCMSAMMEARCKSLMWFLFLAQRDLIMVILRSLVPIYPQARHRREKQIISARLDELDSGLKWKRNPVVIIADKAGRWAAYVALAATHHNGGPGPQSNQGLPKGPPLTWETETPISLAGCGGGVPKCPQDGGEKR